ncbi:MAG TPA: carboxypeptidase-like regulatory domain-containing protein [Candidatus Polarisedimenticolia bacterium]|nr:carboxypeptidase-like regulatory domain-containing protein [Candidatus Polarisedimenticolia bacterium]
MLIAVYQPVPAQDKGRLVVGQIRGTVSDAGNRPVAGLLVQLIAADRPGTLRLTGTDEKGRYLVRDLPAGVYDVQIAPDGYRAEAKGGIEVRPPFQNIVDFRLTPAPSSAKGAIPAAGSTLLKAPLDGTATVTVRGELTDQDKQPVLEVSVTLVSREGHGIYQAFSGLDGRFVIDGVPPGVYRAVIASPGHITLDLRTVEVPAGIGLDLSLSLVDYPLNFRKEEMDGRLPPEKPRSAPDAAGESPSR